MIRPVEDFQRAAEEQGITRWPIRPCSICGYETAFIIDGESVLFDAGCYCTMTGSPPSLRSWDDIAHHYNRNQPENNPRIKDEWLREVDAFWGFDQS